MDGRTLRRAQSPSFSTATRLTYRAEISRRDTLGHSSSYYDGGEYSPYCVESLVDLLRGEARMPYTSLELTLELRGHCSDSTVRELARKFSAVEAPRAQVRICSPGNRPVVVGCTTPPPAPERAAHSGKHA